MKNKIVIVILVIILLGLITYFIFNRKDKEVDEENPENIIEVTDTEYENYEDLHYVLCGNGSNTDLLNITSLNIDDVIKASDVNENIIIKSSIRYLVKKDKFTISESTDASEKYADVIEYQINENDIVNAAKEIFNVDIKTLPDTIQDNEYEYIKNENIYIGRLLNIPSLRDDYEYGVNNISKDGNYYTINILASKRSDDAPVACEADDCANAAINENLEFELKYKLDDEIYTFISIKRVK